MLCGRGLAWFMTPPCHGGDRRFESGRPRKQKENWPVVASFLFVLRDRIRTKEGSGGKPPGSSRVEDYSEPRVLKE